LGSVFGLPLPWIFHSFTPMLLPSVLELIAFAVMRIRTGFAIAYQDYGQGKIRLAVVSAIELRILILAADRALPSSA